MDLLEFVIERGYYPRKILKKMELFESILIVEKDGLEIKLEISSEIARLFCEKGIISSDNIEELP
ncbi:MAG: hypothetical protein Kow0037_10630 [Calditrichia bacterium]